MSELGAYKKNSLVAGWTRVEMLLQIYDRAIASIEACKHSLRDQDSTGYATHLLDAHKAMLALHSGLKPDEDEVAFNIARLLQFALTSIEANDLDAAIRVLGELRSGFAAIAEEANQLERSGDIPPVPTDDSYRSIA